MPPKYRCVCETHQCKDVIDSEGSVGTLVDARTLRRHTEADKTALFQRIVMDDPTTASKENEQEVESPLHVVPEEEHAALATLLNPTNQSNYRIDATCRSVEHVTSVHGEIAALRDEVRSISPPSVLSTTKTIHDTLYDLQCHLSSAGGLQRKLDIVKRNKIVSVAELRDGALAELDFLEGSIKRLRSLWLELLRGREAEREEQLQNGVIEYDSGA
jgi:hypothetical protein